MGEKKVRTYTENYKKDAVKLAKEIGTKKAYEELGVPANTLNGWIRKAKDGELDLGMGTQTPQSAMTLTAELKTAKEEIKRLIKENAKKQETIEFLREATAFFASSRQK